VRWHTSHVISKHLIGFRRDRRVGGLSFCVDHVAVHESAFGTSRHFAAPQNSVAIGVTADMSLEDRNRAPSPLGKSFSIELEKPGSIGIANTVF
jgi:hypothetical protein